MEPPRQPDDPDHTVSSLAPAASLASAFGVFGRAGDSLAPLAPEHADNARAHAELWNDPAFGLPRPPGAFLLELGRVVVPGPPALYVVPAESGAVAWFVGEFAAECVYDVDGPACWMVHCLLDSAGTCQSWVHGLLRDGVGRVAVVANGRRVAASVGPNAFVCELGCSNLPFRPPERLELTDCEGRTSVTTRAEMRLLVPQAA